MPLPPNVNPNFDATNIPPQQGLAAHPPGMFDAFISDTSIENTKDGNGGMFCVEYTTPAGSIVQRFNLWNASQQAVEIANKQLSAVCHATGIFKLDWTNDGAALRNARLKIEVAPQVDKKTKEPNGYMNVQRVFDVNGNEPGKGPAPNAGGVMQPSSQPQQPPLQQNNSGGWGTQPNPQPNPAPQTQPQTNAGWGAQSNQAPNPQPQQQGNANPQPQQGGWQQNNNAQGTAAAAPPWGAPR